MSPESSPSKAASAPTDFPELQTFGTEQLQELLTSREAFQKLVDSYVDKSQALHVSSTLIYMKTPSRGQLECAWIPSGVERQLAVLCHVL